MAASKSRRPRITIASKPKRKYTRRATAESTPTEAEVIHNAEVPASTQMVSFLTQVVAALRGIEESLATIASKPSCSGKGLDVKQFVTPTPPAAKPAPAKAKATPVLACCGATVASGIHKSDCKVAYPEEAKVEAPSIDDVRAAGLKYAQAHGKPALIEVLKTFDESGTFTGVPEDRRADLIASLAVEA